MSEQEPSKTQQPDEHQQWVAKNQPSIDRWVDSVNRSDPQIKKPAAAGVAFNK